MSQDALLGPLVDAIETVKRRITEHASNLSEFEERTRVALIDPVLRALRWDVSNPSLVTAEYLVSDDNRERVDYALLPENGGQPRALIEAKKLNTNLQSHRSQMVNYAVTRGIAYAGLTDGNHWELYDVFKPTALSEKKLLDIVISDSPAHESALKLLLLWRQNLELGQPVVAAAPIVGVPTDGVPAPQRPPVTPYDSPLPDRSAEWTPLGEARPTKDNRPSLLKFPDGTERKVRNWPQISVKLCEWLYDKGLLTPAMVPFESIRGGIIVASDKLNRKFEQVGMDPAIYVNKQGPLGTQIHRWQYIANELGFDLSSFSVQVRKLDHPL